MLAHMGGGEGRVKAEGKREKRLIHFEVYLQAGLEISEVVPRGGPLPLNIPGLAYGLIRRRLLNPQMPAGGLRLHG